jgi:GAF domain-containing protein
MTQPSFQGMPVKEAGEQSAASSVVAAFSANMTAAAVHRALQPVRFPGDDGGKSLAHMAQSDLDAALQLLVDRAQYITGASGAAIALRSGNHMICRASAGTGAPAVGSQLQVSSGLTGESVRMRQILRCDDAENDERVNRESCRALGIASVIVAPLLRQQEVIGVFELLSGRPSAFEERDILALQRLGEMIQTAVEQSEAAQLAANASKDAGNVNEENQTSAAGNGRPTENAEIGAAESRVIAGGAIPAKPAPADFASTDLLPSELILENPSQAVTVSATPFVTTPAPIGRVPSDPAQSFVSRDSSSAKPSASAPTSIGKCRACGFPVSEGRKLCVDCEDARNSGELADTIETSEAPEFLAHYADPANSPNWFKANIYWIGVVLVSLATVAALAYLR